MGLAEIYTQISGNAPANYVRKGVEAMQDYSSYTLFHKH